MKILSARPAEPFDSQTIFEWRNDSLTKSMSRATEDVSWNNHKRWFAKVCGNDDQLLLMCEFANEKQKIGVVRFDLLDGRSRAEISINLSPNMRGKGLAGPSLACAVTYLRKEEPRCCVVIADIRKVNIGSQKAFESVGFVLVSQDATFWKYTLNIRDLTTSVR